MNKPNLDDLINAIANNHGVTAPVKNSRRKIRDDRGDEDEATAQAKDAAQTDAPIQLALNETGVAVSDAPLQLAQAEAGATTGAVAGTTAAGAGAAADGIGLGWLALGGLALGGLAAAGGGGGSSALASNIVTGTVVVGPVIVGHGLKVEIYAADGTTKLGESTLDATGKFTVDVGAYTGIVIARLVDADGGDDYLDEATGVPKDLNANLMATSVVVGGTVTLNINPLTTIAAQKAGLAADGSGSLADATAVTNANAAVAAAFGLADLAGTSVVATNGGSYDAADGMSAGEKYGAILAALSGADLASGGNSQAIIDQFVAALGVTGATGTLNDAGKTLLALGANAATPVVGGNLLNDVGGLVDIDTTAPTFSSGASASVAENTATSTTVYNATADGDTGVAYTLGGTDAARFNINATTGAVTFTTSPNYEAPADNGGNSVYDITVTATDAAGNATDQAVALTVTDVVEVAAGDAVIDLGDYGKLIAPVNVDGNWYYHWDRSGDGTSANVNATLNGVQLALPTANGGAAYPNGIEAFQPGTAIDNNPAGETNPAYSDLLAIWDGYNGTGTGTAINGTPSGWAPNYYWSATPSTNGHALVSLSSGYVRDFGDSDNFSNYVALQVLFPDTTAPTVSSVAITSATGIQNSTLNAGDVVSVTVTLSEATTVTGTPQLALNIGGTTVQADYASGSGTTALVFNYTILAGQTDANGISIASDSFSLNGGTLVDAAGNNATLTHALVADNASYLVDTTAPVFSSGASTSVAENTDPIVTVYDATANGDTGVTYTLGGTDAALFGIHAATGAVTFITSPDFEAPADSGGNNVYDITVTATDPAGNATDQAVAITVTDVAESDVVTGIAITSAIGIQNSTLNAGDVVSATVTLSEA
ncbi:MAG: fg-gap repeat-containing protein, partial [Gallionellaceae bacterium]